MAETRWSLCKENLHPGSSSSRDTLSAQRSLPLAMKSDSSVCDSADSRPSRPALTPLHGSQPSMFATSAHQQQKKTQTASLGSVKEPEFHIYQDETDDDGVENDEMMFMSPPPPLTPVCRSSLMSQSSSPGSVQRVPNGTFNRTHDFERMALSDISAMSGYSSSSELDQENKEDVGFDQENKENVSPMQVASSAAGRRRQMAGVLAESQTIAFIPLDVQEMILDQDETEQNEEIFCQMMIENGLGYALPDGCSGQVRRWSV